MKNYFIDEVQVIINSDKTEIATITGQNYNPNIVKTHAIQMFKEQYPDEKIAAVIINHRDVTIEEYRNTVGKNPPWLGNLG